MLATNGTLYKKKGSHKLRAYVKLVSFPDQFFLNRMDVKNRPGIDCIDFVRMHQIFVEFQ